MTDVRDHGLRPAHPKPTVDRATMPPETIAEYRSVASEIGLSAHDIMVEEFRAYLASKDFPTFNLGEVISYMDSLVAKDNPSGFGWHWCPVRLKDSTAAMTWGTPSRLDHRHDGSAKKTPASDFYESHRLREWNGEGTQGDTFRGNWVSIGSSVFSGTVAVNAVDSTAAMQRAHDQELARLTAPKRADWRDMPSPAYTRTLPLHALKKIALIEREFGADKAMFLVTEYTTAPHSVTHPNPDPFLMAVIPNSAVAHGKGRFIIDVWDEPGFGIDRMVR